MGPRIGYHTSSAGGYFNAVKHAAVKYDLEVFQFFLGSPRTWSFRDLKKNEIEKFKESMEKYGFNQSVVHLNYLANPSTPNSDQDLREKTITVFENEIRRADLLGVDFLVFHIGSHKGRGFDSAKPMIIELLNHLNESNPQVKLLLETSAGSANSVGSNFEEIGQIIDGVDQNKNIGVCFDTCHVFAAGYDIADRNGLDKTMELFDQYIGLERLMVVHANDSKGKLGEGKDRHANIGEGFIGIDGFKTIIAHPAFSELPFILETPSKNVKNDISTLKSIRNELYPSN